MSPKQLAAIYWDASAILSVLFRDSHSEEARAQLEPPGVHLVSSLGWAETCAVISRMKREGCLADMLLKAAYETLEEGPWRRIYVLPDYDRFKGLADAWPLRGTDLWHLAAAKTLQKEIPELKILTFDERLRAAAEGEGLGSRTSDRA